MPLFHFQVRTDSHVFVTEPMELADTTLARIEAAKRSGDLLREHAEQIWTDENWQVDITDAAGLILFVLHISAHRTSATSAHGVAEA
ncbi:DUF6894 family protein [Terrihabitans rhizophilus]|uniref:DUF6894 domain-containing protein n=1 Tax=Terrihabitans rhizophilus TaxID=3092662 RepID=A0ABU4RN83_9HYPH|nr:hypothetical protein [Terrihabitans sp. PJ23]MDX6806282.1 hypothetical protein [Terrihabitans sp. PJ23]